MARCLGIALARHHLSILGNIPNDLVQCIAALSGTTFDLVLAPEEAGTGVGLVLAATALLTDLYATEAACGKFMPNKSTAGRVRALHEFSHPRSWPQILNRIVA